MDNKQYLREKCEEGLIRRGINDKPHQERLDEELNVILDANLEDFFLNTSYICCLLRANDIILADSRGSAGGSLVSYVLNITQVDPLKFNLSFARFLNPERAKQSMPDIDTDIQGTKREHAIELIKEDYGENRVFQVPNLMRYSPKTALKAIQRIYDLDFQYINKLTKLMGDEENTDKIKQIPEIKAFFQKNPQFIKTWEQLIGELYTYGKHAGAVLTLPYDIENIASTLKQGQSNLICYDKTICEDTLGLLKNDLLGLNTLDIIAECLNLIGEDESIFKKADLDDPNVYKTINKNPLGIFQLEGAAGEEFVKKMQPKNFSELSASLALIRPGAMDCGDTDRYIQRKFGQQQIEYDHPLLKPILERTQGCILYQEQLMQITKTLAGFSDAEADKIRKAIGKKKLDLLDEYKIKFTNGCRNNNISDDVIETIWEKIHAAGNYSFNESHSVGYALLSFKTGYLKAYYPIEFYVSLLNNTSSEEKRVKIYSEIQTLGELHNPDINISKEVCSNQNGIIYLSFPLIKGVGPAATKDLIENQPYESFEDFLCKKPRSISKTTIKALIEAGTFDRFNENRDELYSIIDEQQHSWTEKEKLFREFQRIKINPENNVLNLYDLSELKINKKISTIEEIQESTDYQDFYIKVLTTTFETKKDYAFLNVTDGIDSISLFVPDFIRGRYIDDIHEVGTPLVIHIQGKQDKYSILSLINLQKPDRYQREQLFYTEAGKEKLKQLQKQNPQINVGVIQKVKPFISKNGNKCSWFTIYIDEDTILEDRLLCSETQVLFEGMFVFFYMGLNETFPQIEELI